jgi:hypothetical protein
LVFQPCFATFIEQKIAKLQMTLQPSKIIKISTHLEYLEFYKQND